MTRPHVHHGQKHEFVDVSEAPDRPVFELRRLPDKSNKALLQELRRVAALIPGQVLTVSTFVKHGRVGRKIYNDRFGGWAEALAAAGLSAQASNIVPTKGVHPSRSMSNDDIIRQMRNLAGRLGVDELSVAQVTEHLPFSGSTLRTRWGTAHAAFEAAGLTPKVLGNRYSDEDCFQNLLNVWTHHGKPPRYSDMALPPSRVGGKAYMLRFGTWNKALAAFVERINAEPAASPLTQDAGTPSNSDNLPEPDPQRRAEDARDIPLGLRFRVLHRDRFKCVLCGDHPARNAECHLHVDHILPWSKGGKTRDGNLRTLCVGCNVGRGNRFTD